MVQKQEYTPYGQELYSYTLPATKTSSESFAYYSLDQESGLHYARNRYYDSATGSFTQEDPIGDGSNWYAYCAGDPINYTDRWGLKKKKDVEPRRVNQWAWSDQSSKGVKASKPFGKKGFTQSESFSKTACFATTIANELSEAYTSQTGKQLTEKQMEMMMKAAVDKGYINKVNANGDKPVEAVNAMWDYLEENAGAPKGEWVQVSDDTKADFTMIGVEKNDGDEKPDHWLAFVGYDKDGNILVFDSADGQIKTLNDYLDTNNDGDTDDAEDYKFTEVRKYAFIPDKSNKGNNNGTSTNTNDTSTPQTPVVPPTPAPPPEPPTPTTTDNNNNNNNEDNGHEPPNDGLDWDLIDAILNADTTPDPNAETNDEPWYHPEAL